MSTLFKAENVFLEYDGNTVLKNLSFEINNGDYLCIVGENGSGKSTLIKAMLDLKKISKGKIEYFNIKQNEIGYLSQSSEIQKDFPASVEEIVLSGTLGTRGMRPFYSKHEKEVAKKNMQLLGIENLRKKCFNSLSGGQQQRVLLARAMSATNKLLILDEPVTGLDPIVTNELYEIINELNKKHNITVVMVSHDISASVKYASHILHIQNEPLYFGTAKEYVKSYLYKSFPGGDVE